MRHPLIFLAVLLLAGISLAEQTVDPLPARRAAHLRHGINASEWFAQVYSGKYDPSHFDTYITPDDIALMKQMGFDHVRLSINPAPMFQNGNADHLPENYLAYLDKAVNNILQNGMAVIIDLHPDSDFKRRLTSDSAFPDQFADFWRALAKHYSNLDPNLVFFEVMNEPEVEDTFKWQGLQAKFAAAIRQGAAQHTIIVAGGRWSSVDELLQIQPLSDTNIIYNFHFYTPHNFTHQGATWAGNLQHYLTQRVPYPSKPADAAALQQQVPTELDKLWITRYAYDQWNGARIESEISIASEWAKQRGLVLTCNEFGVFRPYADPQDRAAWIHDLRTALEKYGIGWTMWDYRGSFGVVTKDDKGKSVPDPVTLKALGLQK